MLEFTLNLKNGGGKMGDLRSNHPELFEREPDQCPDCGSENFVIDWHTTCLNCGRKKKHKDFLNPDIEKETLYIDKHDTDKKIVEKDGYIYAIGGDGTLLKAINKFRDKGKPFYGIAAGTVNFLMNSAPFPTKDHVVKKFSLIEVEITRIIYNKLDNNNEVEITETFQAFNDIMIGGDMNSWVDFKVKEKDDIFGKFMGGGLIISTAQGSTGINKNNNGTILPLSSEMWSITGDKTNRKIDYVIKPTNMKIKVSSRNSVKVWVDGANHIVDNVKSITVKKGVSVEVIFNDYRSFKKKRRLKN